MVSAARGSVDTVGILLAAGVGRRFCADRSGHKLEVLIDGVSVAERALAVLASSVDVVIVAARADGAAIAKLAATQGCHVVVPADAAQGMGHSLAAAVNYAQHMFVDAKTLVVALADMPWLQTSTVSNAVAQSVVRDCIVQPRHVGQPGHPVVFPSRYMSALAASVGDVGARELLRRYASEVYAFDVNDSGVLRDVDTPADVQPS